jgi:hypothetical protein
MKHANAAKKLNMNLNAVATQTIANVENHAHVVIAVKIQIVANVAHNKIRLAYLPI